MTPSREAAERLLPCTMDCASKSDWPIEAHYRGCLAFQREAIAAELQAARTAALAEVRYELRVQEDKPVHRNDAPNVGVTVVREWVDRKLKETS